MAGAPTRRPLGFMALLSPGIVFLSFEPERTTGAPKQQPTSMVWAPQEDEKAYGFKQYSPAVDLGAPLTRALKNPLQTRNIPQILQGSRFSCLTYP